MRRLMVVKVGSEEYPAGPDDISNVKKELNEALRGNRVFVTHHRVEIDLLPIDEVCDA